MCDFVDMEKPTPANLPELPVGSPLIVRDTECAANTLYLLAFKGSGDGGKEAEQLLGFLGLPNRWRLRCMDLSKKW